MCSPCVKSLSAPASLGTPSQHFSAMTQPWPELQPRCSWAWGTQPELPSPASHGDPCSLAREAEQLLAPLSLEKVVNGFYVLQMITSGTGAEEFLRSAVLPCSQGEAFILWKFDYRMGQVKAGLS